jgi:hypothetical protein
MPLLNYTSKTPAHQSIAEISRMLSKAGARQVMHDYGDASNIVALSFSLALEGQRIAFRLPSDWRLRMAGSYCQRMLRTASANPCLACFIFRIL